MQTTNKITPISDRVRSVDILRALTMFFMIFVNDLWSLTGVPHWLEHTAADEDGIGFSDIIFPLFLFIVGLSIPLAVKARRKKGDGNKTILWHILERSLALLVMGIFLVNYEVIDTTNMPFNKSVWLLFVASGFFLVWLDYKRAPWAKGIVPKLMRAAGVFILLGMALVFRANDAEGIIAMRPLWWGILGLIGWAYLFNSLIYLFCGKSRALMLVLFVVLLFLNIQESGYFQGIPAFKVVISASNHVLVMAGVLATMLFMTLKEKGKMGTFAPFLLLAGLFFIAYGFGLRDAFIFSKIRATPSWTAVCIGIGLLAYAALYFLVDMKKVYQWADPLKPAGTSTLTCYLLPYFIYPIMALTGFVWPAVISEGWVGLVRSLLFSLAIILVVGIMEHKKIRVKV